MNAPLEPGFYPRPVGAIGDSHRGVINQKEGWVARCEQGGQKVRKEAAFLINSSRLLQLLPRGSLQGISNPSTQQPGLSL